MSRLISLSCSQNVLPVAVSHTFQWDLCPDTQKYPEEEFCSVRQKLLAQCHQRTTILFQVPWVVVVDEQAIVAAAEIN